MYIILMSQCILSSQCHWYFVVCRFRWKVSVLDQDQFQVESKDGIVEPSEIQVRSCLGVYIILSSIRLYHVIYIMLERIWYVLSW